MSLEKAAMRESAGSATLGALVRLEQLQVGAGGRLPSMVIRSRTILTRDAIAAFRTATPFARED